MELVRVGTTCSMYELGKVNILKIDHDFDNELRSLVVNFNKNQPGGVRVYAVMYNSNWNDPEFAESLKARHFKLVHTYNGFIDSQVFTWIKNYYYPRIEDDPKQRRTYEPIELTVDGIKL